MANINLFLFVFFGFLPSILWLLFYLRQDDHPEPKRMILMVFFWGMLSTIPALAAEKFFRPLTQLFPAHEHALFVVYIFLGIALVEEICKFLVVRMLVYKNSALDEPVDLIMYMVTAAFGFSAMETIVVLFGLGGFAPFINIFAVTFYRFWGAAFVHGLSSAILGYFLALSFAHSKKRMQYVFAGIASAALLHGLFDFIIIEAQGKIRFFGPLVIFIITILFISFGIAKLKKMKSVCIN